MGRKIASWIVDNRVLIAVMSIGILLLSFVGMGGLNVNYDFNDYLPSTLSSIKGMKIITDEFGGSETVFVILTDKTKVEADQINEKLKSLPYISETFWYSDVAGIYLPDNYVDRNYIDQFFVDGSTIIQTKLKDTGTSSTKQKVEDIYETIGRENISITGSFVYLEEMRMMGEDAKTLMLIMALIISLIVLGFALTQPAYSILFLLIAGISIIINFGFTYLLRGQMSFISSSVAAALQIAVTLDYAVFLLHRYEEEKHRFDDHKKAMIESISKTSASLFSSGLTTAAGFLALMIMSYKMMGDMGMVMAQGVAIGFILTLTLLPALILFLEKPLSNLKHRQLIPNLSGLGRFVVNNRAIIVVVFIVVGSIACFGNFNLQVTYNTTEGFELSEQTQADLEIIGESFGSGKEATIIMTDCSTSEQMQIEKEVSEITGVESARGSLSLGTIYIPDTFVPEKVTSQLSKGNRNLMLVKIVEGTDEFEDSVIEELQKLEDRYDEKVIVTGEDVMQYDLARVSKPDLNKVTLVSVIAILLIIFLSLRKLWQTLVIVLSIEVAIWINISFLFYSGVTTTFFASFVALSAIQLGATVDYCILLASRFNEEKQKVGVSVTEAMINTVKGAGPAIMTAAATLFGATFAISLVSKISMVRSMTTLFSRGAIISMLVVLLVLPALLVMIEFIKGRRKNNA